MSCLKLIEKLNNNYRLLHVNTTAKRMFSDMCKVIEFNQCSTTTSFKKDPCEVKLPPQPIHKKKKLKPSMWGENPDCCGGCNEDLEPLRHDIVYLKTVNWKDRKYQRTWYECPRLCIGKKTCKFQNIKLPVPKLRARGVGNPDAKMNCKLSDCYKVDKLEDPCPLCKKRTVCTGRVPACCRKRCTLYPSFSECCRRPPKPPRPSECFCLAPVSLCAVNEYLEARGLLVKDGK